MFFNYFFSRKANRRPLKSQCVAKRGKPQFGFFSEPLEVRILPSVTVANAGGSGYAGLNYSQSGGYVPPDPSGAVGPNGYMEVINSAIALYPTKATGVGMINDRLSHFMGTVGGLPNVDSGAATTDPTIVYDDVIGRFIVGVQNYDMNTHLSVIELAVSKTSNPATLAASDWTFYQISTTEANCDADFPGNIGYNGSAVVITLNMLAVQGTNANDHVLVLSVNSSDLAANVSQSALHSYHNDVATYGLRPTTMHGSVAGDPMWLVADHGDFASIDVYKMTNVLSNSATITTTNLAVTPFYFPDNIINPNGTQITSDADTTVIKSASANGMLVACQTVAATATQNVAQWYEINIGGATPSLVQQGRVGGPNNSYVGFPSIDINSSGTIGMTYFQAGNDSSTDYMSMWVTGRAATDPKGTMQTPVLVAVGTGQANYKDFTLDGRAGDLSGISVDPIDGSFWGVAEFANTLSGANWGTAIANFNISAPVVVNSSADMAVTISGPSTVTSGTNATYVVTITNNGPNAAQGIVLSDALPSGAVFVSTTQTAGSDAFTLSQSGGTATATANGTLASGASDTFTIVVTAPASLAAGSAFNDTATISTTTSDPTAANNSATASGTVVAPAPAPAPASVPTSNSAVSADLSVTDSAPATAVQGNLVTYTIVVTNNDLKNTSAGVVLTDTLGGKVSYSCATTSQGSYSQANGVVTFTIGSLAPGASSTFTVTAVAIGYGPNVSNSASVKSTTADPNKKNNTAGSTTAIAAAPYIVSSPIVVSQTTLTSFQVGTFTHANGTTPITSIVAKIVWGDGTSSIGTILLSGTTYTVAGSHTYTTSGNHSISLVVGDA